MGLAIKHEQKRLTDKACPNEAYIVDQSGAQGATGRLVTHVVSQFCLNFANLCHVVMVIVNSSKPPRVGRQ